MRKQNPRGDKPHDERTDVEEPDSCGCGNGLECFEHYERPQNDGDTDAESVVADGGLTRMPHIPELGDIYVIDGSAHEVACFGDSGSAVVFEPIARPTSEVIMPVNTVRTTEAATYVE